MSRPYAEVIGDPISHSKSPLIHNFWLKKLRIEADYRACHVRPEELADYFAQRRGDPDWRGCNITIPHKVHALQFIDDSDRTVVDVGATNCVVPREGKLIAFNTDVDGAFKAVCRAQTPTCMIGAGGAARAVMPTLGLLTGVWEMRVVARDKAKAATALPDRNYGIEFFDFDEAARALRDAELVINASPLGMNGQPPMPQSVLDAIPLTDPHSAIFDMVYAPLETELLKAARANGREAIDGLVMLVGQAKTAFEHFFGQYPDKYGQMDAELRALLIE